MPIEYFHLDYRPVDFFIGRLQTRLRGSSSSLLRERFSRWDPEVHGEPALAVVAKIEMLNRVVARLNHSLAKLVEHLKTVSDAVEICVLEHRALSLPDRDLLWDLSVDVDSFLFEGRSIYELLGKFVAAFFGLIFERRVTEPEIIEAIQQFGTDMTWVPVLREGRKLFFHSVAPWLAVERIAGNPPQFDLLLLKRNVEVPSDGEYLHFRDCRAIQMGLREAVNGISLWIANEIAAVEGGEDIL
jgi:hypothetical protein